MSDQRRYSDKEVALILQRAAEMSQAKSTGGMTAAELERVALEAGIDPSAVRLAAEEVARGEARSGGLGEALLGGPVGLRYVFELDGEIAEEHHEALLAAVQRNLDVNGVLNIAGRTFSWQSSSQNRSLLVQVAPVRGKTVVRIEERLGALLGGIYGGVGGGVGGSLAPLAGVGAGFLLGPVGAVLAVGGSLLATYLGTRAIYGGVAKRRKQRLDTLAADLRATLDELLPAAARTTTESALVDARARHGLAAAPALDDGDAEPREERVTSPVGREESARRGS